MRYLDLDTAPRNGLRPQHPPTKLKRWLKFLSITGLVGGVLFTGYSFFWPAAASLSNIFKAPQAVLSFIQPPEATLKSTNGRTNFLLLGIDRRSYEPYQVQDSSGNVTKQCFRSDTMIIASVDLQSKNHDVVMISIPRDTWVQLPGWGSGTTSFPTQGAKINAANCFGDLYNYPNGGGLGLARNVVQNTLGIPIHYVVRVDFDGFEKMVNTVGGISVNVDRAFTDCEYPIEGQEDNPDLSKRYMCVSFKAGPQFMDAPTALEFVRSRHAPGVEGSDLARAKRQQKVMIAIRDKALTIQNLSDPAKISSLIGGLGDTFQTLDVDLGQIGAFYRVAQEVNADSAQNIVLTDDPSSDAGLLMVGNPNFYGGAFVFIPKAGDGNFLPIQQYIQRKLDEASLGQTATSSAQPSGQ